MPCGHICSTCCPLSAPHAALCHDLVFHTFCSLFVLWLFRQSFYSNVYTYYLPSPALASRVTAATLVRRGSYNNPSNWYRGASDAGAGAGMGPAERSGAGQRSAAGAGVGTGAGAGARAGQDSYREARAGQDSYREARAGQDSRREARAGQDSRREARVGQTARAEARQEARMGSAQDRRAARSSKAW